MIPDLGRYALVVCGSYGVTLGLLAGLVAVTLWQGRRARRDLDEIETRLAGGSGGE